MATFDAHTNFGVSTVTVAPVPAAVGLTLDVADASLFPAAPFNCTVCPAGVRPTAANAEIIRVTVVVGNTFTIVRAQEGSTAKSIAVGWQIANTVTRKVIVDLETAVNSPLNLSAGTTSNQLAAVTFLNSNGVSFGLDGSTITASVVPPTGAEITVSAGTSSAAVAQVVFSNSNNVSFGLNGSTVTASATVASTQGSIRVSAGTTSALSSAFTFSNSNNVSFGIDAGTLTATATVASTQGSVRISAGTTSVLSSGFTFSNSNGVGFGIDNGTITASHNGLTSQSNQNVTAANGGFAFQTLSFSNTQGVSFATSAGSAIVASIATSLTNIRVSGGTTSNLLSAMTFGNGGGVSFGLDGSTLTAVAPTQTNQTVGLYASSNTTLTSSGTADARSISVRAIGSLTAGYSAGELLLSAPNALTSQSTQYLALTLGGNTAGTTTFHATDNASLFLHGGNNITLSGNGASVTISGANVGGAQTGISGIIASDATYTSGSVYFSGQNNLTIGTSVDGASQYVRFSVGNYLTTAMASNRGSDFVQATAVFNGTNATGTIASGAISVSVAAQSNQSLGLYMSSNTTSSVSSGTVDARSMTFRGMGVASVGYSGGEVVISVPSGGGGLTNINVSAGTTSNNLSALTFADSNGVSFGLNASTITATVATYSTVGTATTGYPVASANSVGTVTRWAAEDHRHAGVGGIGISTGGNTAGTTGSQVGTYWLQGTNAITLSQITSNNGSHTLVISGSAPITASYFANLPSMAGMVTGASAITQSSGSSIFVQPFMLPYHLSVGWLRLLASYNDSAVGTGGTPVVNSTFSVERYTTWGYVVYSQGVGASSRSIQSLTSSSEGWTGRTQVGAAAQSSRYTVTLQKSYPVSGTTSSYTTSYAMSSASIVISSNSNTLFTGPLFLDLRFGVSLNPGNYWLGLGMSTGSATNSANISFATTAGMAISLAGVSNSNVSVGVVGAATAASDQQLYRGLGVWTTNALTFTRDSIGVNSISQVVSNPQVPFQFMREV